MLPQRGGARLGAHHLPGHQQIAAPGPKQCAWQHSFAAGSPGGPGISNMQMQPPISPLTPLSVRELRQQLRRARNAQSLETSTEVMRQRQLYIMDLETQVEQELRARREGDERSQRFRHSY
eukprot:760566-Pleurochrysis_carterae.AAC.5